MKIELRKIGTVVVVLLLIAAVVIVILAILGSTVKNSFSTLTAQLDSPYYLTSRSPASDSPASEGEGAPPSGSGSGEVDVEDVEYHPSLLAGAVDDNADFNVYLQYRQDYELFVGSTPNVDDVDVTERHVVRVATANGLPVLGAEILFYDGQHLIAAYRTPATGIIYFHPLAFDRQPETYVVTVTKDNVVEEFTFDRSNEGDWDITLDVADAEPPVQLDVLFLLDSTGSMGDEIDQLKENMLSISAQINALPGNPDVHYGLVIYRDRGDDYVTQSFPFTEDIQVFQKDLIEVTAEGGDDTPEALNEGLYEAINGMNWRVENTSSLVFLVSDARPHMDYANDISYADTMQDAVEYGIKIHTVATSGLDRDGDYIFRQIAQYTGGYRIFLTYSSQPQSDGEAGRDDLSVTEGTYGVEDLDALIVRLVREELSALFEPIQ